MDPVTLYARNGRKVTTDVRSEVTSLQMQGYSTTAPTELPVPDEDVPFNPANHTIDEVLTFMEEHPELADAVLAAEAGDTGKQRAGLLGS